jgi:hypothetical protein
MSYLGLRRAIGFIGIFLPLVLALGKIFIEGPGIQGSISAYYYTVMRNVFVGSLCAIGVFLVSYRYQKHDIVTAVLAGIFAIGVALFPTAPEVAATATDKTIGTVHVVSAALFFLTLAYISLFLFTKTYPEKTLRPRKPLEYLSLLMVTRTIPGEPLKPRKKWRNVIYRICGYTILACIALLGLVAVPSINNLVKQLHPVFWLESIAVVAFGFSWLIKGETLLKDRKSGGKSDLPAPAQVRT